MQPADFLLKVQVDLVAALVAAVGMVIWLAVSRRARAIFKRSVTHPATNEILEIADHEIHIRALAKGGGSGK